MRNSSVFLIVSLLLLIATSSSVRGVNATQSTAYVCINPPVYVAQRVGEYYDFDVNVLNVQNLNTVRFTVSFNASTLQFLNVTQQAFFPSPPASSVQYQADMSLGLLKVNMSLANPQSSLSGNGILVRVFFKINQQPTSSMVSPITFTQLTLLDSSAKPISSDSVGGICFWKSIGPDPPGPGLIKEYTDKGGGSYMLGETVVLFANVTFAGDPVANKLVAFQVLNPANATVIIDVATTNGNGIATISFGLPDLSSNIGIWTSFANVEVDQVTYSDVVSFRVTPVSTVGGYSFVVNVPGNPVNPVAPYTLVFSAMILCFVFFKPRRRKQQ